MLFVVVMAKFTLGDGSSDSDADADDDGSSTGPARWREFVVICTIPCWISVIIGYCCVPESPRWLCTQGRTTEALNVIRQAARTNGLDVEFLFPAGMTIEDEEEEESDFCELFSPKWRWTTMKLWGAWGFFAFGYYGTIMVITEIFDSAEQQHQQQSPEYEYRTGSGSETEFDLVVADDGGQQPTTVTTAAYSFDYWAIFVSSSAELVGTTVAILSVDAAGRIPLQLVAYTLAGVSVCALCLAASNHAHRKVLIALGFAARIFEMTGSCVSWVSTAEILTTDVRTTGHSAANAVARIGSLFAPFLIEGHSSLVKKGLVMLAIHAGTVLCVSQLPETKGAHMGRIAASDHDHDHDYGRGGTSAGQHHAGRRIVNTEDDHDDDEHEDDTVTCHDPSTLSSTTATARSIGDHSTDDSEQRLIT